MIDSDETQKAAAAFTGFLGVIKKLREPDGCPWDKEQTPLSMRRDLIEETFEAVDAITARDAAHAKEELGDIFLNTVMIAYMYEQNGDFTIAGCINELAQKLVRRHPHVFPQSEGKVCAAETVRTSEQVLNQWERIKETVEGRRTERSVLDEVPKGFPPLLRAYKLQKKAAKRGFDWSGIQPVYEKITEELSEAEEARRALTAVKRTEKAGAEDEPFTKAAPQEVNDAQLHLEEEIGDILFAVVNYARKLGVDPESALNRTNSKFYRRFSFVEAKMKEAGIPMDSAHLKEEDEFWDEAKRLGI